MVLPRPGTTDERVTDHLPLADDVFADLGLDAGGGFAELCGRDFGHGASE